MFRKHFKRVEHKKRSRLGIFTRFLLLIAIFAGILVTFPKSAPVADTSNLTWTAYPNIDHNNNLESVSCPSATFCVAVDHNGNYVTWNGKNWTTKQVSQNSSSSSDQDKSSHSKLNAVSCATASFCGAVDSKGNAYNWNGTTWSITALGQSGGDGNDSHRAGNLTSVSCPSSGFCMAVDNQGSSFSWNGSGWHYIAPINEQGDHGGSVSSLSCASSTFCMAVDANGNSYTWNGSAWTNPVAIDQGGGDGNGLSSVSCPTSTFCMAVDNNGNALTWQGGTWSTGAIDQTGTNGRIGGSLTSVSCTSTSFCVAVDNQGNALVWNGGTNWSVTPIYNGNNSDHGDENTNLSSVSCSSTSFCAAVDNNGDAYVAVAPSIVSSITPHSGSASGGTSVTITGSGFTGASQVLFGNTPATSFSVTSDTSITAVSPGGTGTVQITVTTLGGTSVPNSNVTFTYSPTVTGLDPSNGPATGGTPVTITGNGFTGATAVDFGSVAASSVVVVSNTEITAVTPPGSGSVQVAIVTPSGTSILNPSNDSFGYVPIVTSITPANGPVGGGTSVTIAGVGFIGTTAVDFGSTAAATFAVNSAGTSITATSPAGTGTVQVTVKTPGGTSVTNTSGGSFIYSSISSISPTNGPAAGGTPVTITGVGLTGATAVDFGSTPATEVSVNSAGTSITATSPAGTGTVQVTVKTPGGTLSGGQFIYAPVVTGISPTAGIATGGTVVTITGIGLTGATSVNFGSTPATKVSVNSAGTSITATSPAGTGTVQVTVTTPGGPSALSPSNDSFTYIPVVTGITPTSGPATGKTTVTVTGSGFTDAKTVLFGSTPATSFTVVSASEITAVSPGGSGTVQIAVSNSAGTSALASSTDSFTYIPVVIGISPSSGSATGGTTVIVTGSGFTGASGVSFGSTPATKFTVISDTVITAVSPGGTGTVVVTVINSGGTSPVNSTNTDDFTYAPVITGVSPNSGPQAGASSVTITGTGFAGTTTVQFGSFPTTNFTVNANGTSITAISPTATSTGVVDITVTTANGGTSSISSADRFTYLASPTAPILQVVITSDATGVASGSGIGFTITASNSGGQAATSATLSDTLPSASGVNWSVDNGPSNCSIQSGVLTCGPASLSGGGSYTVHVISPTTTATCGTGLTVLSDNVTLAASNVGTPVQGQSQINVVCMGSASGQVVDANNTPIPNASIDLCPTTPVLPGQACASVTSNSQGYYTVGSLPAGSYTGLILTLVGQLKFGPIQVLGGAVVQIPVSQIAGAVKPMSSTVSIKSGGLPTETAANTTGTLPNILSTAQTTVTKDNACPNAISPTFTVYATDENPNSSTFNQVVAVPFATNQPLVETPPHSGDYIGTFPALGQYNGAGQISMDIPCPTGAAQTSSFTIYIDPSGQIVNQSGQPLAGVTVTLLTSPSGQPGTYTVVPQGSAIMSPANRTNPQTTDSTGTFGWDVIAGYYEITSSLSGCTSTPLQFVVPPSLSNISMTMNCSVPPSNSPLSTMAPTDVSAAPGNASATVNWTAPQNNNGAPITGYVVVPYIGNAAQAPQTFNSTVTTEVVTGLTNGTPYTFKVAAVNSKGIGPISDPSNVVVPSTVPSAPTNVTATPGNTTATIIWTAPVDDGGSPITAYMITPYIGSTPQTPEIFNTNATADTVTGLTNGTPYTFKVAAINAAGTGPNSASSNAVTPESALGPPPPPPSSSGGNPIATVNSSSGSPNGGGNTSINSNGTLVSPSIGSAALATSQTFNISDTANIVGGLTNGSVYTFVWFFGWLLICVISGRYFFYRRRDLGSPGRLRVVAR